MLSTELLPFLLFILFSSTINCNKETKDDKNNRKAIKELKITVREQTGLIEDLTETVLYQRRKIEELHKSLDENVRENEIKRSTQKDPTGIMKNLVREEKIIHESPTVMREIHDCSNPFNCAWINGGNAEGVLQIYPNQVHPISARCEKSEGGGWTVIQRRFDGSVDFYRDWEEYAEGFGDPNGEYWLGLRHIYNLTQSQPMELYVGVKDFKLGLRYAKYDIFSISSEEDKFILNIGEYTGNAGDALGVHNGQRFSTKDQDNDQAEDYECSQEKHGAWWYKSCYRSNLNGLFSSKPKSGGKYMNWYGGYKGGIAMKASVMKIRPINFKPVN